VWVPSGSVRLTVVSELALAVAVFVVEALVDAAFFAIVASPVPNPDVAGRK
jgi:hypothetical protein